MRHRLLRSAVMCLFCGHFSLLAEGLSAQTLGDILGGDQFQPLDKPRRALDALYGTCMAPEFDVDEFSRFAASVDFPVLDLDLILPMMRSPAPQVDHRGWLATDWVAPLMAFFLFHMRSADGQATTCLNYFGNVLSVAFLREFRAETAAKVLDYSTELGLQRYMFSVPGHPALGISLTFSVDPSIRGVMVAVVREVSQDTK